MSFFDRMRGQKLLSFSLILLTLTIGVLIGTVIQTGTRAAGQSAAPGATPLVIPSPVQVQNEFTKIAKRLEPSVVNISTEYIPKKQLTDNREKAVPRGHRQQVQPDDEDEQNNMPQFLQRFFGNGGGGFQMPEDTPSSGVGSGVVVDPNGYILTNNHVVEKSTRLKVRFMDDTTDYPATVVGTDKDTDLAVIHVDRKGLPAAKIGNSDALQVGDWAVAIGSPFGFQATVTVGIVSALARDIPGDSTSFQHFIQTDAAINPGNSGGPLLNINGDIIGINTMIASRSGGNQGIGFALPINTAVKVYNDIIKQGHVTRGSIGISFDANPKNGDLLKVYGADHGVFVRQLTSGGPAEKAGIRAEDVVTEIGGKPIRKGQDLIDIVADTPVGTTLKVGIMRDRKPMTVDVKVGDRTQVFADLYGGKKPSGSADNAPEAVTSVRFGITIQPLRQTDRDRANYKGEGVLVSTVE
ncbi:MAG TPA: trypsin-like peptidase domain-containing protein, partial [Bryobacteraceae bacterium]|nr:trypsin-like peptidase domain-containing protein [Bryobacteraceae bacterium]